MNYCDACGHVGEVVFVQGERKVKIKDEEIKVLYNKPVCPRCCGEIYDDNLETYISTQVIKQYKRKMRMVTSEELARYLKKVNPDELAERILCSTKDLVGAAHGGLLSKDVDARLKKDMKKMA